LARWSSREHSKLARGDADVVRSKSRAGFMNIVNVEERPVWPIRGEGLPRCFINLDTPDIGESRHLQSQIEPPQPGKG
jgi:hypothetical protein